MDSQPAIPAARFSLGVVIPVPSPVLEVLAQWRRDFGPAQAAAIAPHVTLVSGSFVHSWHDAAEHVRQCAAAAAGFEVSLGPAATFRPASDVVYLPLRAGADDCWALHRALVGEKLRHESAFAYHPHLTIAQDLPAARLDAAQAALSEVDLSFTADRVQLFDTHAGQWTLREEIALAG